MANMLLVDDDKAVAATIRTALEIEGHRVEYAWGAQEAAEQIAGNAFEAAIMDLSLQDGDGLELLKLLKGTSPATVAIVLTGYGSLGSALEAVRAGAFDYLLKPCDMDHLRTSIERGLQWQRTAAQVARLGTLTEDLERLVIDRDRFRRVARQRAGDLRRLDRLKEEFIAVAGHEMKSPLTSIRGFAQVLQRRVAAPDLDRKLLSEGLAVIDSQAAALDRLLDALLDASRVHADALDLLPGACDLGECLATVLARLSPRERGRINVQAPGGPCAGRWDHGRVEQLLANLLANALKYSPEDSRVGLSVELTAREVEVAVRDEGMGIPPDQIPHLFQRFYRTPQARTSGQPGSGLGLYICHGIVSAHGGRLWVESPGEGLGTTFRFTLPRGGKPRRRPGRAGATAPAPGHAGAGGPN